MSEETKETKPVFDASRPIGIKVRTPKGIQTITVRFPTDEEWIERQSKRQIITRSLGDRSSETTVADTEEIDGELLKKIRLGEDGIEVDNYEASSIFDRLQRAEVIEVIHEGDCFKIILRVLAGIVTSHTQRMPTAKEEFRYRKSITQSIDTGSRNKTTINLAAAADTYQKLSVSKDGYAGEVPIVHKAVIVPKVMEQTRILLGDDGSENF
jgi:hypothetical protein